MFWVYALQNPAEKFYVGQTDNLPARLANHNRSDKISGKFTRKNGPWPRGHSGTLGPRINHRDLAVPEVIDIASGDREVMTTGGGREETVDHWDLPAGFFGASLQLCPHIHLLFAEGKQTACESGQQVGNQPTLQIPPSFPRR